MSFFTCLKRSILEADFRKPARPRRRSRPQLEMLEDRLAPAVVAPTGAPTPTDNDFTGLQIAIVGATSGEIITSNVTAINEPPVNTVPGPQNTNVNTPITFSGANQISISDPDAGGNSVQVTLTVSHGTLTLNGTSGLTFSFPPTPTATPWAMA